MGKKLAAYVALIIVLLITYVPVIWTFLTSIKPKGELFSYPLEYLPEHPSLNSYLRLFSEQPFLKYLINSIVVAAGTTILAIAVSSLAGYSLARLRFPGRNVSGLLMLVSQMAPLVLILIPLYILMKGIGLLNSRLGLILTYTCFAVPFCTWMLRGFFMSIPKELEEAAMIDGCNRFSAFLRVALPLSRPGITATAIFAFILAWNEFLIAFTFINKDAVRTLPVAIYRLIGEFYVDWGVLSAAGIIMTIPVVVLFLFIQKYLVTGLTAGAMKE